MMGNIFPYIYYIYIYIRIPIVLSILVIAEVMIKVSMKTVFRENLYFTN